MISEAEYAAERQEALSKKYVAPMVLSLESGRYAFFGANRELLQICDWSDLHHWVESYTPPAEPERVILVTKKSKITLTLEDLDL